MDFRKYKKKCEISCNGFQKPTKKAKNRLQRISKILKKKVNGFGLTDFYFLIFYVTRKKYVS